MLIAKIECHTVLKIQSILLCISLDNILNVDMFCNQFNSHLIQFKNEARVPLNPFGRSLSIQKICRI